MSMPFLITPVAIALITIGVLTVSPDVGADVDPYRLYLADRGAIPWQSLSREEQDALQRYRRNWERLSPQERKRLREEYRRRDD